MSGNGGASLPSTLAQLLPKLQNCPVLLVGDLMLDQYLFGDAERISPEAPVPVVLVEHETYRLGGLGNVAKNIKSLGGAPLMVTACGTENGRSRLDEVLESENLRASVISLKNRPVTTKTRVMARQQQMLRIDHEMPVSVGPDATASILEELEKQIPSHKVLIVSDYNKGVVSRELMDGIQFLRKRLNPELRILVDPKTGNFHLYDNVYLLTPNTAETGAGAGLPVRSQEEIIAAGRAIFAKLRCENLLTTLGANGMALFKGPYEIIHIPTMAKKVFDVTGAGDTVIATFALGLAAGLSLEHAAIISNYAAGIVVGEVGSASTTLKAIKHEIESRPEPPVTQWL